MGCDGRAEGAPSTHAPRGRGEGGGGCADGGERRETGTDIEGGEAGDGCTTRGCGLLCYVNECVHVYVHMCVLANFKMMSHW